MGIGMVLVIFGLLATQFEGMIVKYYGEKYGKGGMLFNAIICLFAMIYFFVTDKNGLQFHNGVIIYGIINSTMYAVGFYATYAALKVGSFGLTRLFTSFGVIISTFYGILFLGEPTTIMTYLAFSMILVSLFLMNYQKQEEKGQKITLKWVFYVLLIVISNAAIAIIGRMQFGVFGNEYNNEFLIISFSGASIYLLVMCLFFERDSVKTTVKYGLFYGAGAGILNGINNLLTLITYKYLPISFTSPVKSGLGMALSLLVSVLLYKERFSRRQLISAVIGVVAVVLMNF